ncbi:hypothetical protein Glove_541g27 [Diversispora epigaea]|uniref:Uncharacterized protein n=1 Tax=Diversispora epigaea TaxID=1348612 RepID=A0A397GLH2_9GLOM|nr:hypothetical protein Glove_541g27 [Diversispora epigaea]
MTDEINSHRVTSFEEGILRENYQKSTLWDVDCVNLGMSNKDDIRNKANKKR